MRVPFQLAIILAVSFAGDFLHSFFDLPIPGNILGMLLLFLLLCLKIVKPRHIEDVAGFFLKFLPFFFIPAAVSIVAVVGKLQGFILSSLVICVLSTAVCILVTGHSVQLLNKLTNNVIYLKISKRNPIIKMARRPVLISQRQIRLWKRPRSAR